MRFFYFLLLALASLNPAAAQPLNVAAAASLTEAMGDVARAFEATRAGVTVQLRFGASGALLQDIADGQPADVFASADADTLARGIQRRLLVADTQREFATNSLVLIVPTDRNSPVQRLQDLARPEVRRIAMGRTATVPAGRYAKQAIDALRLWPALQQKLVAGDSVRAVLEAVASGDADAGFVYATDAALAGPRVRVVQTLAVQTPVRYPATVVAASSQPALARDFVLFLNQPAARAIFARHGFGAP
ncbi:MAG TPA: molybdate ABC transporter substrate-binding protein [Rubrivivax sp.]|nr:molybdate ABC transporter substrate-binding protein [Rubrivivax sp.]